MSSTAVKVSENLGSWERVTHPCQCKTRKWSLCRNNGFWNSHFGPNICMCQLCYCQMGRHGLRCRHLMGPAVPVPSGGVHLHDDVLCLFHWLMSCVSHNGLGPNPRHPKRWISCSPCLWRTSWRPGRQHVTLFALLLPVNVCTVSWCFVFLQFGIKFFSWKKLQVGRVHNTANHFYRGHEELIKSGFVFDIPRRDWHQGLIRFSKDHRNFYLKVGYQRTCGHIPQVKPVKRSLCFLRRSGMQAEPTSQKWTVKIEWGFWLQARTPVQRQARASNQYIINWMEIGLERARVHSSKCFVCSYVYVDLFFYTLLWTGDLIENAWGAGVNVDSKFYETFSSNKHFRNVPR